MTTIMRRPLALAALGLALAGGMAPPAFSFGQQTDIRLPKRETPQPRHIGRGHISNLDSNKSGPGWTAAQVKRMAKKRRNQALNRKAHRG